MKKRIKVFILSANRPKYLLEAVDSVRCLNLRVDDIVVLDNGSEPELMADCRRVLEGSIVWLGAPKNLGFAWNFARAFEHVDAEYVMALHDDDRLLPHILDEQLRYLDSEPDVVALGCNGYRIDECSARDGRLVLPSLCADRIIRFENSAEVALHIYSAMCIPFSSIIFRARRVRVLALEMPAIEQRFGQSLDAAFLMTLADSGVVALNTAPLYECRIHRGQDSNALRFHCKIKLMEFAFFHAKGSRKQIQSLRRLINSFYTANVLVELTKAMFSISWRSVWLQIRHLDIRHLSLEGVYRYVTRLLFWIRNNTIASAPSPAPKCGRRQ